MYLVRGLGYLGLACDPSCTLRPSWHQHFAIGLVTLTSPKWRSLLDRHTWIFRKLSEADLLVRSSANGRPALPHYLVTQMSCSNYLECGVQLQRHQFLTCYYTITWLHIVYSLIYSSYIVNWAIDQAILDQRDHRISSYSNTVPLPSIRQLLRKKH